MDLLVSVRGGFFGGQFHPVQRALAGQRPIRIHAPGQYRHDRIFPQPFVIVQVFVAEGKSINALREHLLHAVMDPHRIASVPKTLVQTPKQPDPAIRFAQQQTASVGCDLAAIKTSYYRSRSNSFKLEARLATLCGKQMGRLLTGKLLCGNSVMPEVTAFCYTCW